MQKTISCMGLVLSLLIMWTGAANARPHRHDPIPARPAPPYQSTTDLAQPVQAALDAKAHGRRVLVVFDIDNTLLTTPQDLGGDTWFNWQKKLDNAASDSQKAFDDLLANNAALLQLSAMTPTQPDTADLIRRLQAQHIAVYALSARNPALRGVTEAAFAANHIDLSPAPECGPPLCARRGQLGDAQIRAAARKARLTLPVAPQRNITVSDGLMMVSGQNKGAMLRLLLVSLRHAYDDVYFVDDTLQNVRDVEAAAPAIRARVHAYSYERFWPDAADFMHNAGRQAKAAGDYAAMKTALCAALQSDICARPVQPPAVTDSAR